MLSFYIYIGLIAACLIAYLLNMRHLLFISYCMMPLLAITVLSELLDFYNVIPRQVKANGYQVAELVLLAFVYFRYFKNRNVKKGIAFAVIFYFISTLILAFKYGLEESNLISLSISHLIVVGCSLFYLRGMYEPPFESNSILANALAWISFGNLVYFVGMFMAFGAEAMISEESMNKSNALIYFNMFINYTMYILYFMGAICHKIFK